MRRLHHCHEARSMRSLWLLHELGLEFELVVHSFDKALRDPAYLALSPAGRVPAFEDGDLVLFETGAITEYLVETYPEAGLGRPFGHPERVEWLQWLHFAETIGQHCAALTQQHIVLYDDAMRSPILMKIERMRLEKTFAALEAQLAGREYVLASGFSALDTNIGYGVYVGAKFTDLAAFPNVAAYYGRLKARPAFQKALPPEGVNRLYKKDFYEAWDA